MSRDPYQREALSDSLLAEVVTEEIPSETGHRLITLWLQWESTNHI